MVFNYEIFNKFCQKYKQFEVNAFIIAGVFIISSYEGFIALTRMCKVEVSREVLRVLTINRENQEAVQNFGIFLAVSFIKQVLTHNTDQVLGIHFFSLNKFNLVRKVCKILGFIDLYIERPFCKSQR
ncbi:hypothetical protein RI129_004429 [Pyrocoelia pectoralis]|uniref:Methylenetetrahydrofolate reductase (NAD(P)H) n=1 Tax=Pyrocoelia pectoralis TaxID=417401 RepID=A0AAN7ZGS0_9COLE